MSLNNVNLPSVPAPATLKPFVLVAKPARRTSHEDRMWKLAELFDEELSLLSSQPLKAYDWICRNCGSHERMAAVMHLQNQLVLGEMDFSDWLIVLGRVWTGCDNIGHYKNDLVEVFKEEQQDPFTTMPELMSRKERAAFEALPNQVTIYRGCGSRNRDGLSWSLRREVAMRFPFTNRYETDQPLLLTATVAKNRIAALKLDRKEHEVIVVDLPVSYWTEEQITELPPASLSHP